ncbi:hypothetical protein KUTG_04321 [Kutzneria sp. 744]|nr:hypothetical protein KUTG_04321 [Kutzneria sp. 744]
MRIAAGLAVTAVEQARKLPEQLTGLPVTVVSQALQLSMRVQQRVTELAIKGDDALASLRPVEETPDWATFDEDDNPEPQGQDIDPWLEEERAVSEHEDSDDNGDDEIAARGPSALPRVRRAVGAAAAGPAATGSALDDLEQLLVLRARARRPPGLPGHADQAHRHRTGPGELRLVTELARSPLSTGTWVADPPSASEVGL